MVELQPGCAAINHDRRPPSPVLRSDLPQPSLSLISCASLSARVRCSLSLTPPPSSPLVLLPPSPSSHLLRLPLYPSALQLQLEHLGLEGLPACGICGLLGCQEGLEDLQSSEEIGEGGVQQ